MLPLWLIQKHFVWLRIPVFLSLTLSVFLSVCVCKWERPQCLPALGLLWWTDGQSVRDRLPFQPMRKQDPCCRHGDSCHEWLHPDLQLMIRGFDLCLFGGEGLERAALASIPFTFPSGRGLPLCSWLHMAQRCPSGPWQPHAEGLQEFNLKLWVYI